VEQAAAGDEELVGCFSFFDAKSDVGVQFAVESLADVTAGW
jgi:hypothetical protein